MVIRKFKPGDRVKKIGSKQVMILQNYRLKRSFIYGTILSDREVECSWYENGKRKTGVFDQRTLTKVSPDKAALSNFEEGESYDRRIYY